MDPQALRMDRAGADDRERLAALCQLYIYDLSDAFGIDLKDDGRYRTPSLEAYFVDPRCHAFIARVEGRLAGFALVQERSRLTGDESVRDIAEFFVLRRHRRRGVGEAMARWLFDRFQGRWEVRQRRENAAATSFWRRAIARHTGQPLDEELIDDERWRGPVQRLDSAALRSR